LPDRTTTVCSELPFPYNPITSNALHALCDAGAAGATEKIDDISHPGLVIAATILASSLAFIDGSVVNVGLPALAASFQADAVDLQWVINAYLLPLSALLLLGGAAGDRFGRRGLLIWGVGLFALTCAVAPSLRLLLAARFLQGVSAAIALAWLGIPRDRHDGDEPLDSFGAILATAGLGLTTWSLTEATSHDCAGFTLGACRRPPALACVRVGRRP
jgi:MFS family permease